MKQVAIAIDSWKLPIFTRHLAKAGYQFEEHNFTRGTLLLKVQTADVKALGDVVKAANAEAARTGPPPSSATEKINTRFGTLVIGRSTCPVDNTPLVFVRTAAGKAMPCNDDGVFETHYATCADAERFRRRDRRKDPGGGSGVR